MATRKHPSREMLKELDKVFTKHNWSGAAIGLRNSEADNDDPEDCPPGTTPKKVTYKLPDGTWVTKTICV
jgi:hypothetical protein